MKNGDKPANPVPWEGFDEYMSGIAGGSNYGLTKREEFAKAAMCGFLAAGKTNVGVVSVQEADALLAALEES